VSVEQVSEIGDVPARAGGGRERIRRVLLVLVGITVLIVAWELATEVFHIPPYIMPTPKKVLDSLLSGLLVPFDSPLGFYGPMAATVSNAALGFMIGGLLGLLLGSLMAEFETAEAILMPYAFALQTLPKVAIAPLIVIWCGFGDGSKVTMAALLAFFPILVNTFTGIRTSDPDQLDLMRTLRATRLEIYRLVKLPTAAPYIFAAIDMAIVYALLGTIVAEFLGAQAGIGVTIMQAQNTSDVATVFAALVLLAIFGIVLHLVVRAIFRRIVHWNERTR
jgi:NitT/TauT family transport system permease protein